MTFNIITIFPELFESTFKQGLLGQAISKNLVKLNFVDPRRFTTDNHRSVDDRPFGGGDSMVMMTEPLAQAVSEINNQSQNPKQKVLYLSAQGTPLNQKKVFELSGLQEMTLICGRYGGLDQRFINIYVDEEISIGDFVLSGGEFAAMVLIDAVARLLPEFMGNPESAIKDSFTNNLLEGPIFTRPRDFEGQKIPDVLLSGDHKKIEIFRNAVSYVFTLLRRPDLLADQSIKKNRVQMIDRQGRELLKIVLTLSDEDLKSCGLKREILEGLMNE